MKHLVIAFCLLASFAQAQVSQRYAQRIYRVGDQLVIADSLGKNQSVYPYSTAQIVATNSLVRVNISGLSKYYTPPKVLTSTGVPYSLTSTSAVVAGILATVPDGTIPTDVAQIGGVKQTDYDANKTATDLALSKTAKVIRVDSYGGTGKAAIESAISAAQVGDKIILPTGNINIAGQITVNKRVNFVRGEGITRLYQTTPYTTLFHVTADSVSFDGIIINQTGTGDESNWPTSYGSAITFYRVMGGFVTNCIIRNAGEALTPTGNSSNGATKSGAGIYTTGSSNILIQNNKLYACITGVNNDDYQNLAVGNSGRFFCNNVQVKYNYFENCYRGLDWDFLGNGGGIDFDPGQIIGNKIVMLLTPVSGATAIKLTMPETLDRLLISDNKINGKYQDAIGVLKGCRFTEIINNKIDGAGNGITYYTQTGFQPVRNQICSGNTILNCTSSGITVSASLDIDLSNNEIAFCRRGIYILNFSFSVSATKNNIHDNVLAGIIADNVHGLTVSGGTIINNSTDSTNGYRAGIIINQPNGTGVVSGVNISLVRFDYVYNDGATGATVKYQKYAIKTVGTYWSNNANNRAGIIANNTFGRCATIESMLESSGGLAYRLNPTATSIGETNVFPNVTQAQRTALTPTNGQVVAQTDGRNGLYFYSVANGAWVYVLGSKGAQADNFIYATTTYQVGVNDNTVFATAATVAYNVNLPSIAAVGTAFRVRIIKTDATAFNITVVPSGTNKIIAASNYALTAQGSMIELQADATNNTWWIIASR